MNQGAVPKWKSRLATEREYIRAFERLNEHRLHETGRDGSILSSNHDTVITLDWPHYCSYATEACGGPQGWCYTFAGFHVTPAQARKVALNDVLARRAPRLLADLVSREVMEAVRQRRIRYPNLRFSGSGEVHPSHIPALVEIASRGIQLWGFTKNPHVARALKAESISVLFSCDQTTPAAHLLKARSMGVPLAYTSTGVNDRPPVGTLVTFPVHVSGRVSEVVDDRTLCPKVEEEFLAGVRTPAWCQARCKRCHCPQTRPETAAMGR